MTISSNPLRAAIIGVGVGRSHARGYQQADGVSLVAACDIDSARVQNFANEFNIPEEGQFSDYQQLLAHVHPDIVSVCLPNYLHADVAIAALESGADVLCEKPMAITTLDAERMLAASQRTGRTLAVAYNFRCYPDTQWMKQTIDSGVLGDIYHVEASWRREKGIPGRAWFGHKALSGGGPLIDIGVHVLDLALWFMNFPAVLTVSATTRSIFGKNNLKTGYGAIVQPSVPPEFDVEDGAVGFLRLANGADLILQASWAEHRPPNDDLMRVEVQGSRGSIVLNVPNYKHDDSLRMYMEMSGQPVTIAPTLKSSAKIGHEGLVISVVDALRSGTPVLADGKQGLAAVRVLEAMYRSANEGAEIRLPQA